MKKTNIIAAAAVAATGIATYLVRKKLRSRKAMKAGHPSPDTSRQLTDVFAETK